ncbi:MAG: HAD family hydrolase [Erysipelotrichaceae bacterium]|nr:HAD family hydrolase [Erysipelotrichaceae bacterium]
MIKGIIFDLDGTTLNTLKDIHESFNKAFKEYGLEEKSLDEVRMGVGNGFRVLTKKLIPQDIQEELVEEIALYYQKTYAQNYYKNTRPYAGVSKLLSELQKQGVVLAVHSNKSDVFVKDLIARNFPEIRFTEVCGSLDGVALKPDPEGVYRILKLMGLSKKKSSMSETAKRI